METKDFTTTILTASENMYLTESDESINIENRSVITEVALGKNSSVLDWKEITKEEGDNILNEQAEIIQNKIKEEQNASTLARTKLA